MKTEEIRAFSDISEFMQNHLNESFSPFAYYDKHLDCIRVQIRDCSITETRLNRMLTIYEANHTDSRTYVGFAIKGIRYLFEELGLPSHGVYKITALIDALVKAYPGQAVKTIEEAFKPQFVHDDLEVTIDLPEAA